MVSWNHGGRTKQHLHQKRVGMAGGVSFSKMNKRLPEVAAAIKQHDTTGMAESFEQIENRLKEVLITVGAAYPDGSNILVVTHAFFNENSGLFI